MRESMQQMWMLALLAMLRFRVNVAVLPGSGEGPFPSIAKLWAQTLRNVLTQKTFQDAYGAQLLRIIVCFSLQDRSAQCGV